MYKMSETSPRVNTALVTVIIGTNQCPVDIRYEPREFVIAIKQMIVSKLKTYYPRELMGALIGINDLTLKYMNGIVIEDEDMPDGRIFLGELVIPEAAEQKPAGTLEAGLPLLSKPFSASEFASFRIEQKGKRSCSQ